MNGDQRDALTQGCYRPIGLVTFKERKKLMMRYLLSIGWALETLVHDWPQDGDLALGVLWLEPSNEWKYDVFSLEQVMRKTCLGCTLVFLEKYLFDLQAIGYRYGKSQENRLYISHSETKEGEAKFDEVTFEKHSEMDLGLLESENETFWIKPVNCFLHLLLFLQL